jgi:hypothetical protein
VRGSHFRASSQQTFPGPAAVLLRPRDVRSSRALRPLYRATLLFCLVACERPNGRTGTAVRDSAGVQIVHAGVDGNGAEWRLSDVPSVEVVPAPHGAANLYQVVSAFRMADGRIVVANAGSGELHVYGADGRHQRTIGRKGRGPGEFGRLFWAGRWRGDSIAAWDAQLTRLTIYDADGSFARTLSPRAQLGFFPQLQGVLADGSFVLSSGTDASRGIAMTAGVRRDTMTLVVIGPDGAVGDTLGRFPGAEQYLMVLPGGGFVMHPLPFGRTAATAAQGSQIAVGSGDVYQVALYEPARGLQRLIRAESERRRVTGEDVRRYRETMAAMGAEGDAFARRQQEQFLREVPFPERMPSLTAILPDGRGNWWIQDPPDAGASGDSVWRLVSGGGRLMGVLRAPAGLAIKEIGPDWVLGVYLDDNDVEHVRLHALMRSRGPDRS